MEKANESLYDRTLQQLEERRQRIVDGGVNCIPSPFKRFSNDFCGIEQDTYYCITSFTKGKISLHLNTFNKRKYTIYRESAVMQSNLHDNNT